MRILFVSDYAAWLPVSRGEMPSNHLFGIHQRIERYYTDSNGDIHGELSNGGGQVDFYLIDKYQMFPWSISRVIHSLIIWLKSFRYDVILDAVNQCRLLLVLNRLHLLPCKIVTILHHPPFYLEEELGKADAYLFFSKNTMQHDARVVPSKEKAFFLNEWGPDSSWYPVVPVGKQEFICCDDGKTQRDIFLEKQVIEKLKIKSLATYYSEYTEKLPVSFTKDFFAKIINAKIMFIPIKKDAFPRKLHAYERRRVRQNKDTIPNDPCGLTSFMDAVALGMPVICSDNTAVAEFVLENDLGRVYSAGNVESAIKAFSQLLNDDIYRICKENITRYRESHSIEAYSVRLFSVLEDL